MRRGAWRDKQAANARKKEMFADILEAERPEPKKKSKKGKEAQPGDLDNIFAPMADAPAPKKKSKESRKDKDAKHDSKARAGAEDDISQAIKGVCVGGGAGRCWCCTVDVL